MTALRSVAGVAVVVVVTMVLAGCTDDERPPDSRLPANTDAGSSMSTEPVADAPAATAASRLLTHEDIGEGFVPVPYEPPDPSQPAPCGGPSADSQWVPEAVVGAEADRQATSVQVVEELRVYADEATAAAGFDALVGGLDCPTATLVGPVASVAVSVGPPVATASGTRIDVAAAEFAGSYVMARMGVHVVTVQVFAPPGSADAPDPSAVADLAVAKLRP